MGAHMLDDRAIELPHEVDGLLCRMAYQDDMDSNRFKQSPLVQAGHSSALCYGASAAPGGRAHPVLDHTPTQR
jgi:hypothetical protein